MFRYAVPWDISPVGRAIGPVVFVCAPRPTSHAVTYGGALLLYVGGLLVLLAVILMVGPLTRIIGLWACSFPVLWGVCLALLMRAFLNRLKQRLILGQNGLALSTPLQMVFLRWDDLGTLWQVAPGDQASGSVTLVRVGGRQRIAITPFFARSEEVAARVLTELARRLRSDRWEVRAVPESRDSEAISPAERDIAETQRDHPGENP
jgi:hypothetical protein